MNSFYPFRLNGFLSANSDSLINCFVNDSGSGWRRVSSLFAGIHEISARLPSVTASWAAAAGSVASDCRADAWRVMSRCDLCCVVSVTQLAVGGAVNVTTGRYHDEPRATLHTRHTLAVGSLLSRPGTPDCSSVAIQLAIHDSAHVR